MNESDRESGSGLQYRNVLCRIVPCLGNREFTNPVAPYHAILRGNRGQTIFSDDRDPTRFCFLLREGVEQADAGEYRPEAAKRDERSI